MRVIFLNTLYYPSPAELARLENIQLTISGWRVDLAREWHIQRYTAGERYLSKQRFHNGVRSNWKIFHGYKSELSFTDLN
jgi:hypothetical protein